MALYEKVFQLKLTQELLDALHSRTPNVSDYIRSLVKADLAKIPDGDAPIRSETVKAPYAFYAQLRKVVDGDTLSLTIDLGFSVKVDITARLEGVNTPELNTKKGKEAKAFVENELAGAHLFIETKKQERYGRYLAKVFYQGKYDNYEHIVTYGKNLSEELLKQGFAEKYTA